MNAYQRYDIQVGQVYKPTDGSRNRLIVRDVLKHAERGDVVVFDEAQQEERRIDAYKLARVRYYLADIAEGQNKQELLHALREGRADPQQQHLLAQLFRAMENAMDEQRADVRRGRFIVDSGEWRRQDDPQEGKATWLCVRVRPDADLSCKGTRAAELDLAILSQAKESGNPA